MSEATLSERIRGRSLAETVELFVKLAEPLRVAMEMGAGEPEITAMTHGFIVSAEMLELERFPNDPVARELLDFLKAIKRGNNDGEPGEN